MSIFIQGNDAFVEVGNDMMLCIGTKKEVDAADAVQLYEMVYLARSLAKYRAIEDSKGQSKH